jgi:hypothetical protein
VSSGKSQSLCLFIRTMIKQTVVIIKGYNSSYLTVNSIHRENYRRSSVWVSM